VRIARFRLPAAGSGAVAGVVATGIVDGEEIVHIGAMEPVDLLAGGPDAVDAATKGGSARHPLGEVELLAPVPNPRKFLAIGINYADHIRETGREAPTFPVFFNKQVTCVTGPHDPIQIPRVSSDVDFEGELGIVIGRRCRHVPVERAHEVIAGYLVVNDVTVRDWQYRSPTWTLGKSFDTHGPTGPWITTSDEVGDPQDLRIRTLLNGETMQDASTSEMIFGCSDQIATLSTAFTLEPGDLVSTGTPAGVGFARQPPVFLRAGDTVRIEIDGVGAIENPVVDEPADTQVF
jgi:2-keto-4-pentenoate hydratase/2-oxohepta-3-ene-1,7-dioic acid hydratase in catechol pathway